jgi:hypothetical protein
VAINENALARAVAQREGKKEQLTIAQVKECLCCTLDVLAEFKGSEVLALVEKHADRTEGASCGR